MYRVEDLHCCLRVVHGRRLIGNVPGSFQVSQARFSAP